MRSLALVFACVATTSCGWFPKVCADGPQSFVAAAGLEVSDDGAVFALSARGRAQSGGCGYSGKSGSLHRIASDGGVSARALLLLPGLHSALSATDLFSTTGDWSAGGLSGGLHVSGSTESLYSLALTSLEPDVLPAPPYVQTLFPAGQHVFVLASGALLRHDAGEWTPAAPGSVVRAATRSAGGSLLAVTDSGSVLEIDPDTLVEEAEHPACDATSIAPFGPSKLVLGCPEGIGVLDPIAASFAVISTDQGIVALWGGYQTEAALVVAGAATRVFAVGTGGTSEMTGWATDAVMTGEAAFAVLSEPGYGFHDSRLVRIPFDGSEPEVLLDGYGPMQAAWNGAGDVAASNENHVWRLDPETGAQTDSVELFFPPAGL